MMKPLSFKITSDHLLLCVFLSLLWGITDSNSTSTPDTMPKSTETSVTEATPLTTLSTTNPPPEDVKEVTVLTQNDSSITLTWNKVNNISTYFLQYVDQGSFKEDTITGSNEIASVTHVVSSLTAGTKYNFTVITVFEGVNSTGYTFSAPTAPEDVKEVTVLTQNDSSITLTWNKVKKISTYFLQYVDQGSFKEDTITGSNEIASVTHVVSSLTAGTKYNFTVITVFEGVNSTGYTFSAPTAPEDVMEVTVLTQNDSSISLTWNKVKKISTYFLQYVDQGSFKEDTITGSNEIASVTHVVSSLTAGTKYNFTVITVFEGVNSTGYTFSAPTAPEDVMEVTVSTQNDSSITLTWNKVNNISTYFLQYVDQGSFKVETITGSNEIASVTHVVSSLTAGTKYNFTVITVFEGVNSTGYTFSAPTAPEDVMEVTVLTQNDSSITLTWNKVKKISTYFLQYVDQGSFKEDTITGSNEIASVTHVVSSLTAGTKYNFTVITVFEGVNSTGYTFSAPTAPEDVMEVTVLTQNDSSITLTWNKVKKISTYFLQYVDQGSFKEDTITGSNEIASVTHVVSSLTAGTKYNFTVITVFEGVNSTGYTFSAPTAPEDVMEVTVSTQNDSSITLKWNKVKKISTYFLQYVDQGSFKEDTITGSNEIASVTHVVSSLTAGTKYNFTVITVFEGVNSTGYTFSAPTAPEDVMEVTVSTQNDSSISLTWNKVKKISTYFLQYVEKGSFKEDNITGSNEIASVTHVVSSLTAGTKYNFTVITVFEGVNSTGYTFSAPTVPSMVSFVNVTECSVTSITLEWNVDVDKEWGYFLQMNGENLQFSSNRSTNVVSHSFLSLQPGTEYPFNVMTMFSELNSTAYKGFAVTAIDCTSVTWHVTTSSIQGMVEGLFSNATATSQMNESQIHVSSGGSNVSFSGLYPGATYEVSFVYEGNSICFPQCSHKLTTIPPDLRAHCEYWAAGYSVSIVWNKPDGVWTAVEVNVTGETYKVEYGEQHIKIPGFLPARTYEVSLGLLSGTVRSHEAFVFSCLADPRGVIAGSVFAVLLFGLLVCLAAFIVVNRKKPFFGGSKLSNKKCKALSVAKFPDHFYQLSADENRGFSQEYESLVAVGTEQTRKEALVPENKARNRFNNVLPYDWCRVKLTASIPNGITDYINASYMPGYNGNREYIATQGPLPTTVNDFWRMIWEQRVKGIVMVTNCTESGRTKCEQYWPADSKPCLYGELLVTIRSEQQEPNWTLREFSVKHRNTAEERPVKHFHFTAWPDHGVPRGTEILIQFRELVRQHIEREGAGAPTAVHCSAGVGRTGTIIALDVLLQQLEKERAVDINAFVHKMRLSRPHMVQTESQYVFLHQCVMDYLQQNDKTEENIYENADVVYANATALREFNSHA